MNKFFHNAPLGIKVAFAPCFAVLCLFAVGLMGWMANAKMTSALTSVGQDRLPTVIKAAQLDAQLHKIQIQVNQSLAWEGAGYKTEKIAELDKKIVQHLDAYAQQLSAQLAQTQWNAAERTKLTEISTTYQKYQKIVVDLLELKSGMLANAAGFMTTLEGSFEALNQAFAQLIQMEQSQATQQVEAGQALALNNQFAIVAVFSAAVLMTVGFAWFCTRQIVQPLKRASVIAHAVAQGDLTQVEKIIRATPPV